MREQAPETQCVTPGQAQRLGASCSSKTGTCVLVPGKALPPTVEPDGVIECPLAPMNPAAGERAVYTPPCTRQSQGSSGFLVYDGRGVVVMAGTP